MDLNTFLKISEIAAYLGGAAVFIIMLKADIRILRHDMATMKLRQDGLNDSMKQLTAVLVQLAEYGTKIKSIEDDIRELRHGDGYIRSRSGKE